MSRKMTSSTKRVVSAGLLEISYCAASNGVIW